MKIFRTHSTIMSRITLRLSRSSVLECVRVLYSSGSSSIRRFAEDNWYENWTKFRHSSAAPIIRLSPSFDELPEVEVASIEKVGQKFMVFVDYSPIDGFGLPLAMSMDNELQLNWGNLVAKTASEVGVSKR